MISRTLLRLRLRSCSSSSSSSSSLIQLTKFNHFSSSHAIYTNSSAAATAEIGGGGSSEAYISARKHARPPTVTWSNRLHNSVSLIGAVEFPLKQYDTRTGRFGVHTSLRVKTSIDSHSSFFSITLEMWDELAERAMLHLKPNDYIYVSGELGSFTKSTLEGLEKLIYKVTAKELNYVKLDEPRLKSERAVNSGTVSVKDSGESSVQKYNNRLHLWQIFFANPNEWYDKRKNKKNPKAPDFKHKSTGEALWLNANDPPWVQKQIELLDCKLPGGSNNDVTSKSFPSRLFSDEQLIVPSPIVTATESDFIKLEEPAINSQRAVNSGQETGEQLSGPSLPKQNNRLNLWQKLFSSPDEWHDQRKSKKNQREPDFKHKSTGEELWLNASDPLWVKKKVDLLDSRLSGGSNNDVSSKSSSAWVSDERLIVRNPTVTTEDLKNVKLDEPGKDSQGAVISGKESGKQVTGSSLQKQKNRLHLLQKLFTSPDEWYDNRKTKKNPKQPDFKHKSTGDALWLNKTDPPWVKNQLESLDSRLSG